MQHITKAEEAVFLRFLEVNKLTGRISPTYTTNTRTKPTIGLLAPVDFCVTEYNLNCDGDITREQALGVLKRASIALPENRLRAMA